MKATAVRIKELESLKPILKIGALAEEANIKKNTIWKKLQRETELSQDESEAIEGVLKKYGITIKKAL